VERLYLGERDGQPEDYRPLRSLGVPATLADLRAVVNEAEAAAVAEAKGKLAEWPALESREQGEALRQLFTLGSAR
jgi:hypothetical protein